MQEQDKIYFEEPNVLRVFTRGEQTAEKAEKMFGDLLAIARQHPRIQFNAIVDVRLAHIPSKEVRGMYKKIFEHPQTGKVAYLTKTLPFTGPFLEFFVNSHPQRVSHWFDQCDLKRFDRSLKNKKTDKQKDIAC